MYKPKFQMSHFVEWKNQCNEQREVIDTFKNLINEVNTILENFRRFQFFFHIKDVQTKLNYHLKTLVPDYDHGNRRCILFKFS